MIRETRFRLSDRPYAVDLTSLHVSEHTYDGGRKSYTCSANAVWFRRAKGVTYACIGVVQNIQSERPADTIALEANYRSADSSWRPPAVGIRADDWPVLAKVQPSPTPPKLKVIVGGVETDSPPLSAADDSGPADLRLIITRARTGRTES